MTAQPESSTTSIQNARRLVKRALRDLDAANRELARIERELASGYGIKIIDQSEET